MEIRPSRAPSNLVAFSNIKPGETFSTGTNGSPLFMRTESKADIPANSVILNDGRLSKFGPDEEVLPVKAHVVREG